MWAEQAHVFPDWHKYSSQLSQRAALADRHWLDSIGLAAKKAEHNSAKSTIPVKSAAAAAAEIAVTGTASGSARGVRAGREGVLGRASVWLKRVAARLDVQ